MDSEEFANIPLRYITDSTPGISRKKSRTGFTFYLADGTRITDKSLIARINALAIPPAYTKVWISPSANSHLQATGFDSKNRKQYRYHPLWRKIRQENKFKSMIPFGKMLANIRKHVDEELNKPVDLDKNQIICAIIYLMDNYFIRIGNSTYEKQNQSYGLTTLRKKHLSLSTTKAILEFAGKNSKPWHIVLKDKKLLKILKKCEDIPGYRLFKYLDENKTYTEITSQDINSYLQNLTNYSLTAKDFRTWAACRETLYRLIQVPYDNEENSTALLKEVIVEVSTMLGHTPTICQKYYIVPDIISEWKSGAICEWVKKHPNLAKDKDKMLLAWLEEHV